MYRPKNWENPYKCEKIMGFYPEQAEIAARVAYEAGADAMLEALKEGGIYGKPSGDYECFCMFPPDASYNSPYDAPHEPFEEAVKERNKWLYPGDIKSIEGSKKGWLIFVPDEEA